ncbi:serine/threonine-protein kinase [Nocardioides lianchengensis]|uniref:non-specific serine/threonine protein kinase n=1 Tax=Nocardioides lianchengensis TaxID=1045774 RepID=A0A1G7C0F0_9ACTN|nr:serine/threonine-protein kinase [Nocardioides lianchengensis]NYG09285.1 serine/threonine protein kinase [Nocardioides lianchengensis]SDE32828.1 Serine/threonine protein kinase [Nocardioides lianchengensis]
MIAGRYSLDREVGRGGMGAVWLGRDEVLGRAVAVKRIGTAPGASAPDVERAAREARLAARLSHPHVVAVFDLVEEGDAHWLVMEYVEGSTLAELVRDRGALDPDQAARVVGQAADGLTAAHAAGIVHRDVKPSNILVNEEGQVKLSDFGIAKAEADPSLTQTGLVTGSPAYLAPEVASGRPATDASDVWSLGATLFHALSGKPPYEVGDNLLGALYRIVHEEPPRLASPGWLGPLLEATMTRDPAQRWTMEQVRDFLRSGAGAPLPAPLPLRRTDTAEHDLDGTQVLSRPALAAVPAAPASPDPEPTKRRRGLLPVLVGAAVVVLLTVVGYVLGTSGDDESDPGASSSPGTSSSSAPAAVEEPTAEGMTAFVTTYLDTAAADPEAGFAMLTSAYQEESDGLPGYESFWGSVRRIQDVDVTDADPDAMTVTYTYRYQLDQGGSRRETIRLDLELQDDDTYLISGGDSVG